MICWSCCLPYFFLTVLALWKYLVRVLLPEKYANKLLSLGLPGLGGKPLPSASAYCLASGNCVDPAACDAENKDAQAGACPATGKASGKKTD